VLVLLYLMGGRGRVGGMEEMLYCRNVSREIRV